MRALRQSKKVTIIDVRSESEYADSSIPGSLNIPIFTDNERAEVGTLYKQTSIQAAKDRGLAIVSAKLPAFIREFSEIEGRKVVFCWRGGMRSKTTATVLSLMDIHAYRLVGGFRTYRKWVVEQLADFEMKQDAYVLHGNTGTGKTALLHKLAEEGHPVLDLEQLAGHRGSIFGHVGMKASNQKSFEAALLEELLRLQDKPYLFFEAESKRIGKVVLPEFLVRKKETATSLWIETPLQARVRQIVEDYEPSAHQADYLAAFGQIKRRLHTPIAAEIEAHLKQGQYEQAIALLLEHYYDPRYEHSSDQYEISPKQIRIDATGLDDAFEQILEELQLDQKYSSIK
nr:tRNA 2-selenouridine(34) synthase MnmH [Paenibacillus phyllosphaerae]